MLWKRSVFFSEPAVRFIEWIEEMNERMGIPTGFDCIKREDVPRIIRWADKEANPLYLVPVVWEYADFEKLINAISIPKK